MIITSASFSEWPGKIHPPSKKLPCNAEDYWFTTEEEEEVMNNFEVSDEENEWIASSNNKKDKKRQGSTFIIFCCWFLSFLYLWFHPPIWFHFHVIFPHLVLDWNRRDLKNIIFVSFVLNISLLSQIIHIRFWSDQILSWNGYFSTQIANLVFSSCLASSF